MASRMASTRAPFFGWKKRDCDAEGVGEVAGVAGEARELGEEGGGVGEQLVAVGLDVAAGEGRGVGVVVVGEDLVAGALEGVADAGCPGEQVEDGPGIQRGDDFGEPRDEGALGADVFDGRGYPRGP
jgi:hypothetical protein